MNFDVGICRFFIGCMFETSRFFYSQLPRFTSRKWCGLNSIGPCTSAAGSVLTLFISFQLSVTSWKKRVFCLSVDFPGLKHDFDGSVSIFQSKSSKIFQFKVYLKGCAPNLQSLLLKPPATGANIAWAAKNGLDVGQICQRPGRQNDMEIYQQRKLTHEMVV